MGVVWKMVCHDCKVVADLDKTACFCSPGTGTREKLLAERETVERNWAIFAVVGDFLGEHSGHNVSLINDIMSIDDDCVNYKSFGPCWICTLSEIGEELKE